MRSVARGFRSFRRHPGRNAVIVILLFVCLTFSISMLAVKLAADDQVNSIKETVGTYGEIRVSSKYRMKKFEAEREKSQAERRREARSMTDEEAQAERVDSLVPEEMTDAFSRERHIETYDKVLNAMVTLPDVKSTELETMRSMRQGDGPQAAGTDNSFVFEGNTNGSSASDFTTGQKKIVDGEFYTYKDYQDANPVVMIEKNLADENGLEIGDTIEADITGKSGKDSIVELKVVGIYETVEAESDSGGESGGTEMFNPAGNKFFAPLSVVQELDATPGYVTLGSYYFDNVDDTDALNASFKKLDGSDDKYEFVTDEADYTAIADPLLKVKNTSVIGLAGALGACALIILLAMIITISGRTRELGVLKAIGATDRQVMSQYAMEVVCICLVAIILAMGATALISQPLGNWLLSDKSVTETTTRESAEVGPGGPPGMMRMMGGESLYKEGGFGATPANEETANVSLNVVYSGNLLGYAVLVLLGVSLLGMAVPVVWITRLRPARVLTME